MKTMAISKEYAEKIRGFSAIKPEEKFDYTPMAYRDLPLELRPIFHMQTIGGTDILSAEDSLRPAIRYTDAGAEAVLQRGAHVIRICNIGLTGWTNYYVVRNGQAEFIEWGKDENNLSKIAPELLQELANEILSRTKLTDEERLG